MPTVKLVDENDPNPIVRKVFADIKGTKKIDFIPAIWRALATNPEHLELCWTRLKAVMRPGNSPQLRIFRNFLLPCNLWNPTVVTVSTFLHGFCGLP